MITHPTMAAARAKAEAAGCLDVGAFAPQTAPPPGEHDRSGRGLTTAALEALLPLPSSTTRLLLNDNEIDGIPALATAGPVRLEELQLGNNKLSAVPTLAFAGLSALVALWLYGNGITLLEANSFAPLTSLTFLDLKLNPIPYVPAGAFVGPASSLEALYVTQSAVTSVHDAAFEDMGRLRHLELGENQLTEVTSAVFAGLTRLEMLMLCTR